MSTDLASKSRPAVTGYIRKNKQWEAELQKLRELLLATPLLEEIKWRTPCYTLNGSNVLILGAFKDNCVLSFLKGALLKDPKKLLEVPGPNTQSARVIRITSLDQIHKLESTLKAYIDEAIAIESSGKKVPLKKITDYPHPDELTAKFKELPALKPAFTALTPGRQRAYLMHFSSAKQSATRTSRIEKCIPQILKGLGLDD